MRSRSTALVLAALLLPALGACASHKPPPPEPVASTPPPPPGPPPSEAPPPYAGPVSTSALPGSTQDFVISAGDRVYFDYDQYTVKPEGQAVLRRQAGWLNRYPRVAVRVEGNCDERGTSEYNLALGARRADSVKAFLVSQGVPSERITTISYGKERPLDPGTGEEADAHNRNAHTALVGGQAQ